MNITLIYRSLPARVKTLATKNNDGSYTILVNTLFNQEQQKAAVLHELSHIRDDDFARDAHANIIEKLVHTANNDSVNSAVEFYCRTV